MVQRIATIAIVLLGATGCQTTIIDGQEVQALVIPVPNTYEDSWKLIQLTANAFGYGHTEEGQK